MQFSPLQDKLSDSLWQASFANDQGIYIDSRLGRSIDRMKVRRSMFVPIHLDDYPVESADGGMRPPRNTR